MSTTQGAEFQQLAERVQRLLDREAIRDCLHRYSRGLDRHDRAILSSVYHEDAVDHHGEFLGVRDDFVPWADELLASEWDAHTHVLDLNNVEIDGDTAQSECYVLFAQRRRDRTAVDIGGGRYIDRLERRDGEWRITARELIIDWQGRTEIAAFGGGEIYPSGKWDRSDRSYDRPLTLELPARGN
jgi:SnoaL-like protein